MLKKILITVFMLTMLAAPVYAADITVQGENYTRYETKGQGEPAVLPNDAANPTLVVQKWNGNKQDYYVEYDFNVETAGCYKLTADISVLDSAYTSNLYYSINGGEYVYTGDVCKKEGSSSSSYATSDMAVYSLGIVELKSGTNTIRFMSNEQIGVTDLSKYTRFYLDYFAFTRQNTFEYSAVSPSKPASVFEPSDNVEFTVGFTTYPTENKTYYVTVENYFHNVVKKESKELSTSSNKIKLNFGKLPAGWYRLIISDGSKNIYNSGFSVVHNVSDRKNNLHFAMDFAGMALTSGETEVRNLGRALRLAGIDTVRERYYWNYSEALLKHNNQTVANEGLDIINMFNDSPQELLAGGYMADDLFEVYNFQKSYAENYQGLVDYMEVWNEEDTSFATETADRYASFLKAAAVGITDGSNTMGVSHGGFAQSPFDTRYMDFCMLNDFMEYSDLYNYHAYANDGKSFEKAPSLDSVELAENRNILTAYGYDNRRTWVTEGGIAIADNVERSRSQQARASVINNVQSMANGNDKHFLFVMPQYSETGDNEYGFFLKDRTPSPAYSSLETFTYYMGEARYKGVIRDLPEGTYGYLFNNGDKDIAVFWTESKDGYVQVTSSGNAVMADMMGNEKVINSVNGIVSIAVSMDPVYLIFDNAIGSEHYLEYMAGTPDYEGISITDSKKIVLQQNFENKCYVDERSKGYLIYKNEDNTCTLSIYNFSDKEQSGVINAKISDSFTLDKTQQSVTVPAGEKVDITFKVRVADSVSGTEKGFLQFSGVMNGEEITKSTSVIRCRKTNSISIDSTGFSNGNLYSQWSKNATSDGGSVNITYVSKSGYLWNTKYEGVKFTVKLPGNGWAYPNFDVKSSEINSLKNSTGIKFTISADQDISQAILHCQVYLDDGNVKYFEGNEHGKTIKAGTRDYYFPWSEMELLSANDGYDSDFDFDRITHIAIGINKNGVTDVTYSLTNISWYTDNTEFDTQSWDTLEISGAEHGAVFYKGMAPVVSAKLPATDTIKSVKVYLSGKEYTDYTMSGNNLTTDLSKLDKGVYTLLVTAENDFCYIYRDSLDFIIQ